MTAQSLFFAGAEGECAKQTAQTADDGEGGNAASQPAAQPPQGTATAETKTHLSQQPRVSSLLVHISQLEQAQHAQQSHHAQQAQHTQQAQEADELIINRSRGSAESAELSFEAAMTTTAGQSAQPVTSLPGNKPLSSSKHWPVQMLKYLIQQLRQNRMRKADTCIHSRQQVEVEPLPAATAAFCAVHQQPTAQQSRTIATANTQVGCLKPCKQIRLVQVIHGSLFLHLGATAHSVT